MKIYTPTQKFFSGLSSVVISIAFAYLLVIVLFMNPATWMINIVMFWMNLQLVIYFLSLFVDKNTKEKMQQNKAIPWYLDEIYDFTVAVMFAAVGWWYYAVISIFIVIFKIGLFKKDD